MEATLWTFMIGFISDLRKEQITREKSCQAFLENIFFSYAE